MRTSQQKVFISKLYYFMIVNNKGKKHVDDVVDTYDIYMLFEHTIDTVSQHLPKVISIILHFLQSPVQWTY